MKSMSDLNLTEEERQIIKRIRECSRDGGVMDLLTTREIDLIKRIRETDTAKV